jgi:hypothetical protein
VVPDHPSQSPDPPARRLRLGLRCVSWRLRAGASGPFCRAGAARAPTSVSATGRRQRRRRVPPQRQGGVARYSGRRLRPRGRPRRSPCRSSRTDPRSRSRTSQPRAESLPKPIHVAILRGRCKLVDVALHRASGGRSPLARCPSAAHDDRLAGGSDTRPISVPPGPRRATGETDPPWGRGGPLGWSGPTHAA